jgi:2-polyprenyl-3-methyl-5-hydroxy-6-metoxy-1,4-benzoquinol methylase
MELTEYDRLAVFENTYWWHVGRRHLLDTLFGKFVGKPRRAKINILEVGCGTGSLLEYMHKFGNVMGLDISPEALSYCSKRGIKNLLQCDLVSDGVEKIKKKFDVVVAMDTLEHIQDDVMAMKKIRTLLKKNGKFIVCVPAHKFLWSTHDEALHHKRRYHSYELMKKLEDSGFKILKRSYFIAFAFPLISLYRIWTNLFGRDAYPKTSYVLLPKQINNFLIGVLKFEAMLLAFVSIPFGVTLVAVASSTRV